VDEIENPRQVIEFGSIENLQQLRLNDTLILLNGYSNKKMGSGDLVAFYDYFKHKATFDKIKINHNGELIGFQEVYNGQQQPVAVDKFISETMQEIQGELTCEDDDC